RARRLVIVDFERHAAAWTTCLVLAEALLGNLAGLALGFLLALVTLFFLALAGVGGFTLVAVDRCAAGTTAGFLLGNLSLLGFPHARVRKRMGARTPFFLGQRAEHDA